MVQAEVWMMTIDSTVLLIALGESVLLCGPVFVVE